MIKASELHTGTHFWAKFTNAYGGELAMIMKDSFGLYYVCGGWECPVGEEDFEIIELVPFPDGYDASKLNYV